MCLEENIHFHCISSTLRIDLPLDKHPQFGQKQGLSLVGKFVAINQFVVAEMGNTVDGQNPAPPRMMIIPLFTYEESTVCLMLSYQFFTSTEQNLNNTDS